VGIEGTRKGIRGHVFDWVVVNRASQCPPAAQMAWQQGKRSGGRVSNFQYTSQGKFRIKASCPSTEHVAKRGASSSTPKGRGLMIEGGREYFINLIFETCCPSLFISDLRFF
jgi:hypothetical protein